LNIVSRAIWTSHWWRTTYI